MESIDGRLLYFTKESPVRGVWSVSLDGGPEAQVLTSGHSQQWAVTERGIYFLEGRQLNLYSFETRRVTPVTTLEHEPPPRPGALTVTRDGRTAVVVQQDRSGSDLALVHNFR